MYQIRTVHKKQTTVLVAIDFAIGTGIGLEADEILPLMPKHIAGGRIIVSGIRGQENARLGKMNQIRAYTFRQGKRLPFFFLNNQRIIHMAHAVFNDGAWIAEAPSSTAIK